MKCGNGSRRQTPGQGPRGVVPSLHWWAIGEFLPAPSRRPPLSQEFSPPTPRSSLTPKSPSKARTIYEESEQVGARQDAPLAWAHDLLEIRPCHWPQAGMEACSFFPIHSAWGLERRVAFQGTGGSGSKWAIP